MKEKWKKIAQAAKSFFKNTAAAFAVLWEKIKIFLKSGADFTPPVKEKIVSFVLKWWHWALGGIFAFVVLYYPAGALLYHRIDVNPRLGEKAQEDRIRSLNVLAELIERETDKHAFTPNLPFFFPSAILDNMPAFQTGIINGARNMAAAFAALNSQAGPLKEAAERLDYPVSVWHVDGWKPAISSVKKYRAAKYLILEYETEVKKGTQTFNTSPDALETMLNTLAENIKECIEKIDRQVAAGEKKIWDTDADNVFYEVKGQAYVYFLTLRGMKTDFKDLFSDEILKDRLEKTLFSLKKAILLQPMVVINGAAETQFVPNHLLGLGFYLARSAMDLTDMVRIIGQAKYE